MKFKVGDKVRAKEGLIPGMWYGNQKYTLLMHHMFYHKTMTVVYAHKIHGYKMKEDPCPKFSWSDEMLELAPVIPSTKEKIKAFINNIYGTKCLKRRETHDMKFGIGDHVRIKHNITFDHKLSRTGIIKDIHYSTDGNTYFINHDNSCIMSGWKESALELVGSYKGPAEFTKSDLKDGMVVEFRNGEKRIVLNGRFMTNNVSISMSYFTDDLRHESCDDWSVDKIYSSSAVVGCRYFKNECLTLIWEREKPTYKYKPGDKVKVRSDLIAPGVYDAIGFIDPMTKFMGKTVTIVATRMTKYGDPYYLVKECSFNWTDAMFEGLVDYEEMTVAEIEKKLGYKVKIMDGE